MLPISGLMIIVGVLLLGSALAIPASRAMQEAEMRDRIASFAESEHFEPSESGANLPETHGPETDPNSVPAFAESDEPDAEFEPVEVESDRSSGEPPSTDSPATTGDDAAESGQDGSEPAPEPEPEPVDMPSPAHLRIPDVGIDTKIVEVGYDIVEVQGHRVREWEVAAYAAGHHKTSASPGEGGNIVITGHNDWQGEVFRTLEYVEPGYEVFIETEEAEHKYVVEEIHMRREVGVSMDERLATGQFMADMPEERVTLITCWPYGVNDHRVIVVAKPAE